MLRARRDISEPHSNGNVQIFKCIDPFLAHSNLQSLEHSDWCDCLTPFCTFLACVGAVLQPEPLGFGATLSDMLWVFPRKGVKAVATQGETHQTPFVEVFQEGKQLHRVLEKNETWMRLLDEWFTHRSGEELLGEDWLDLRRRLETAARSLSDLSAKAADNDALLKALPAEQVDE